MKKNRKIYSLLLTLVFACLMLVQASCSNDIAETTPEQVPGGTYLTIVTRGIVTGDVDKSNYEDYVGSLRVIAFKNGQAVWNEKLKTLPDKEGTQPDTEVNLTEQGETILLSSGGGTCTFYFIANEEGHTTDGKKTLESVLEAKQGDNYTITADALEGMKVQFTEAEIKAPTTFGDNTTYMLMSTKRTVSLKEGDNEVITIYLDRALAKAQLVIRSEENIAMSASLSKAAIPDNYYLMSGKTVTNSTYLALDNSTISLDETTEAPFDEKASSKDNKYVSQVVYLPERAATDLVSALSYSIAITGDTKSYSAPIADGTNQQEINYNIIRNNAYTTIGTYDPAVVVNNIQFQWVVAQFASVDIDVPSFN